ncbi:hypothetical protein [Geofilum rhodophaeum]|uniref:hypothetical protein n=1 Tax=Geofilum rhodophaeum TaxID=1965019 RepID=UPI000B527BD6|nr:hypothetical protein [Geofilum rhodophaeum]
MKHLNIIIIGLLFLGGCASIGKNQKHARNPDYKALAVFDNDTLEYVKYNFFENQQFFVGKPLKVLFKDLEATIVTFTPNSLINPMNMSDGVSLTFSYSRNVEQPDKTVIAKPAYADLIVTFTELYPSSYTMGLKNYALDINWGKAQEDFYKDFTIKEIFLYVPEIEPIE